MKHELLISLGRCFNVKSLMKNQSIIQQVDSIGDRVRVRPINSADMRFELFTMCLFAPCAARWKLHVENREAVLPSSFGQGFVKGLDDRFCQIIEHGF